MVNPIAYCSIVTATASDKVRLKCIKFLRTIAQVNDMPSTQAQDLLYKLILIVPELKAKVFVNFYM